MTCLKMSYVILVEGDVKRPSESFSNPEYHSVGDCELQQLYPEVLVKGWLS